MTTDSRYEPAVFKGVMVSSTFTDLAEHRKVLMQAIDSRDLKPIGMEHDSAKLIDVIESSLGMVRKAAAYIGVISHKYGQTPEDTKRNPNGLSLSELEFDEAIRLDRDVLLFIMGDDHPVKPKDVETDPEKIQKLNAFRERAKRIHPGSSVHRVYKVFNSLHELEVAVTQSVADLREHLDQADTSIETPSVISDSEPEVIPTPPALYAEPPYIGSHKFVGRQAQLDTLSDWAAAADPHPVLLFEAIGGAGKSMLTWEWTTRQATTARQDWAGRFWYSFYERGAVMSDFCGRALAYITGRPLKDFRKKKTGELSDLLLDHLRSRPWLVILDGLERVLVAYHRIDAAQVADEQAGESDEIARRDPTSAIRPEDDELLRTLASASPSKLLLTSRLIPRVLLNASSQPIPGVLHQRLPGLRPADAEALLRSCGISGNSERMQEYLQSHCDCHPLVTGILAGLINDYFPDRGNFDAWVTAPDGGAALNLADLDLVQKRNHILQAALEALPEKGRQLLSTLALLSEAIDFSTLSALNPHLPPEPEEVDRPRNPEKYLWWKRMPEDERVEERRTYEAEVKRRKKYERELEERRQSVAYRTAPSELAKTVRELERRGLLQYDANVKRYDLHPVVRGIAAGGLRQEEKENYGQRVVDYFSRQAHKSYDEAESLDDVRDGLHLVRALIQMGRYQAAADFLRGDMIQALRFNLEAHGSILSLLGSFFPHGWTSLPSCVDELTASFLSNEAGGALRSMGEPYEAVAAYAAALHYDLPSGRWNAGWVRLANISNTLFELNRIAAASRCSFLGLDVAILLGSKRELFRARLTCFKGLALMSRVAEAEKIWNLLDPMGREWHRAIYRPGDAEYELARFRFTQGHLTESCLVDAEKLATKGRNRILSRSLYGLRGTWHLTQGNWAFAAESLSVAVSMAREVGQSDPEAEVQLALANLHLGRLTDPRHEAEQLSLAKEPSSINLAALWHAIGDRVQATKHALAGYKWAWADGEPYVRRYDLNRARTLLEQLGAEIPDFPPYDPDKDEKFPWEQDVADAIDKLRKEKEAKAAAEEAKRKSE
jgi:Domain of unknown function (DUF4062)